MSIGGGVGGILIAGAGAVAVGLVLLGAMLFELQRGRRTGGWLLGAGLGLGIIAFTAKLGLIVLYLALGDAYLERALAGPRSPELPPGPTTPVPTARAGELRGDYRWQPLPPTPPAPADNPTTAAKVALGRRLFHDPRLSVDGTVSCASCHRLGAGGADDKPFSLGIDGRVGGRNAPTVINAAYQRVLFWDGRADSLESQAVGPLTNPLEMGMPSLAAVAERVGSDPAYRRAFLRAFPGSAGVSGTLVVQAIAAYERTLVTPDTPYDRFVRGEHGALTPQQRRGMGLFAKFGCVMCHRGPNFSGAGIDGGAPFRAFPALPGSDYERRFELGADSGLGGADGRGVWRVPSLRNVTRTAPYFHNGAVAELDEAVRVMARVQLGLEHSNRPEAEWRVRWSPETATTRAEPNAVINDAEVADIVAFLHALEGTPASVAPTRTAQASSPLFPGRQGP